MSNEITQDVSVATGRTIDMAAGRRAFLQTLGMGAVGAAVMGLSGTSASAQAAPTNGQILNFALNLEYLEAEFYVRAAFGRGLADADIDGRGTLGPVTGPARKVTFTTPIVSKFSQELARHEERHVQFLRAVLGAERVARPALAYDGSFTAAARAAGLIGPNDTFDAFANETNFLLASFIFEDVGVTAYRGASGLLSAGRIVDLAAGILGTEAYHAGVIRTLLHERGLFTQSNAISDLRDNLDGAGDQDQGVGDVNSTVLVPVDATALVQGRTPRQVLNIVFAQAGATQGGFFPNGVNGDIRS